MTNKKSKKIKDPGIGEKFINSYRVINKDGSFNVERTNGIPKIWDIYQSMIGLNWLSFFGLILLSLIVLNVFFALIYILFGVENISGITAGSFIHNFVHAFNFSIQTSTTVGFGAMSPVSNWVSLVASFEALIGLISFGLVTGLVYGKFSRPNAKIIYSKNVLISPYKDGKALMMRIANKRKNVLHNVEANLFVIYVERMDGNNPKRSFYSLKLELEYIRFMPFSWTLVHHLTEDSPIYPLSFEKLEQMDAEFILSINAFDDNYNDVIYSKTSYKYFEVIDNAKFKSIINAPQDKKIFLDIDDIDNYEKL